MLEIYTDGASGPQKVAGWTAWGMAVYRAGALVLEYSGKLRDRGTPNAAELTGFTQALAYCMNQEDPAITIWVDSAYVAQGAAKLAALKDKKFCDEKGRPIAHQKAWKLVADFFFEFDLYGRVTVRWVKGHAKVEGNELADALAGETSKTGEPILRKY